MASIEIATLYFGSLAAVVCSDWRPQKIRTEEDHILRIFDLQNGKEALNCLVRWDSGGTRMCFSPDGGKVYVGCYYVHGFACYSVKDGTEIWRRKDLKGVQQLTASRCGNYVFCGRESGAAAIVDARTGETIQQPRAVKYLYFSPWDESVLVIKQTQYPLELHRPLGTSVAKFDRLAFGVWSCTFSKHAMLLSEVRQPPRLFKVSDGSVIWNSPGDEPAIQAAVFSEKHDMFFAAHAKDNRIAVVAVDPNSGARTALFQTESIGGFYGGGVHFVDRYGTSFALPSGKQLHEKVFNTHLPSRTELLRQHVASKRTMDEMVNYLKAEGFSEGEITKAMFMKAMADRQKPQ